jgi:hypothetical protein
VVLGDPLLVQVEALRHAGGDSFSWDCGVTELHPSGALLVHVVSEYCCGYSQENSYVIAPAGAVTATQLVSAPFAFGFGAQSFLIDEGWLTELSRVDFGGATTSVPLPFRLHRSAQNSPSGYDGPYAAWADDHGGLIVAVGVGEGEGASLELAHVDGSGQLIYGPAIVDSIDSLPGVWFSDLLFQVW